MSSASSNEPVAKAAPKHPTKLCKICQVAYSASNFANHMQKHHPDVRPTEPNLKGPQEYCEEHQTWFAYSQRSRHYRVHHGTAAPHAKGPIKYPRDQARPSAPPPTRPHTLIHRPRQTEASEDERQEVRMVQGDTMLDELGLPLSPDEARTARQDFLTDEMAREVKERVAARIEQMGGNRRTKLEVELPHFQGEVLDKLTRARALSPTEYRHIDWTSGTATRARGSYVVCTTEEARELLASHCPAMPVVVPKAERHLLNMDDFLSKLKLFTEIDVHVFDEPVDPGAEFAVPRRLAPADVIERMHDPETGPINLLNLAIRKQNVTPECLVGLNAYHVLDELRESNPTNRGGKVETHDPSDLSSCTSFHICSKADGFSLPHTDHHGVLTTALCEFGRKLWITYPQFTDQEYVEWCLTGELPPHICPFGIGLEPGDLLIQPPRQVHAPYSVDSVLMTGTMHWDTRRMVPIVLQSLWERRFPHVTNEDPARECGGKLQQVAELWRQEAAEWPWSSHYRVEEFEYLVQVCAGDDGA